MTGGGGPNWLDAVVPPMKLTHYLLALDHPEGGTKASFFNGCGFTAAEPYALADALRRQAANGALISVRGDFGVKLIVEGPVIGLDGRVRQIRSVWILEGDDRRPRLVTAYPLEVRRGDF